jgi:hypothetical protein
MKPYKAKSLESAQRMVRNLKRQIATRDDLLNQFDYERKLMAQLAADTPQFFSPHVVIEAKRIRDRLLVCVNSVGYSHDPNNA